MSNPFFLTRQTANLMEDFARDLEQGSALFLLYGDNQVGKTRLLQELRQTRLGGKRVHWLDLAAADTGEPPLERSGEVEQLFRSAASGDLLIVDHFEQALKKTRHQLFLSWSTDGIDKQLNMIVASSSEGFNELRLLSQQYQVRVQSFQLMPLKSDEVEAFLGFYLFPDHPIGSLSIPSTLRKQLASTHGVIGRVIEIADRDGDQVESMPAADTDSGRKVSRIIVAAVVLSALAVGVGWYLGGRPDAVVLQAPETQDPRPRADTVAAGAQDAEPVMRAAPAEETMAQAPEARETTETAPALEGKEATQAQAPIVETGAESVAVVVDEAIPGDVSDEGIEADGANAPTPVAAVDTVDTADTESAPASPAPEPGSVPDTALESEADIASRSQPDPDKKVLSSRERFDLQLQESLDWLRARDDATGTVQISLLGSKSFDADNFYGYIAGLAEKDVDISRIRVFRTYTGNAELYSVVYGEYASRSEANSAIAELPRALRDVSPIGRSVGGLWQEIRRLDANN